MKKTFLFLILFLPIISFAEISCLPLVKTAFIGENVEWNISGIGEEIPYFISWSGDGIANTSEDSLIYSNKYENIGLKSVRVLFGLEGVEPTYDIVCESVEIIDNIATTSQSTTTDISTPVKKKRRSHIVTQSFSEEDSNTSLILSTSTVRMDTPIITEINFTEETEKKILPQKNFVFSKRLWIGLEGEEVRELQMKLSKLGFFNTEVTGFFGLITQKAVSDFQKYHNIEPSLGFVGPLTRNILNKL
ncbi:MAG: peptidoglycan-binding domain-containing protein [Candidatus Pacebacteria bacterium]|nr:peptidoglycan-binding domain-containing protein [Candidatus Paceibacterota bacterium]